MWPRFWKLSSASYLVCLILTCLVLTACSKTEREEAVFNLIQEGVELAENHDLGGMMDLTDDHFTASPGKYKKKDIRKILFVMLKRYGNFRILYPKPSVKLSDDEEVAVVKMNFLIAKKGQVFPDLELLYTDSIAWIDAVDKNADLYTLSMELDYKSGDWLVSKARITRFAHPHGRLN